MIALVLLLVIVAMVLGIVGVCRRCQLTKGERSLASGHGARRCLGAIRPRALRPSPTSLLRRPRPQPGGAVERPG